MKKPLEAIKTALFGWWWFSVALVIAAFMGVAPAWLLSEQNVTPERSRGPDSWPFWLGVVVTLLGMAYLLTGYLVAVLDSVYSAKPTKLPFKNLFYLESLNRRRLFGALAVTILLVEAFAVGFRVISLLQGEMAFHVEGKPALLSFSDALYFSAITFATVGYGDIVPVSRWARAGVMLEVLVSLVNVTLVLSVLATVLRERPSAKGCEEKGKKDE